MRAVRQQQFGGTEPLTVVDVPSPRPGPDEVVVEIRAAGVNPTDVLYRSGAIGQGDYRELREPSLPWTPGSDFAGVVDAVGERVSDVAVGDRVFGTGLHSGRVDHGSFAEFVAVPVDLVAHLPRDVDFVTGGAVGLAGVTAWRALVDYGRLAPGEACLIHGGSGGVGHVAVQLAALAGARVVATARAGDTGAHVRSLGADSVVDYREPDLASELETECPTGFDVVLDHRFDAYAQLDVDVSRVGARIVNIGGGVGTLERSGLARVREVTVHFMTVANLVERRSLPSVGSILDHLAAVLSDGELTVTVEETYPLADAAAALDAVTAGGTVGKLVVVP